MRTVRVFLWTKKMDDVIDDNETVPVDEVMNDVMDDDETVPVDKGMNDVN